jgi:hypothetical protein
VQEEEAAIAYEESAAEMSASPEVEPAAAPHAAPRAVTEPTADAAQQAEARAGTVAVSEPETSAEPPHAVSILKSGVVDGMAYTLYSDGSIEAELAGETIRFASITELRQHIEASA